ncbi:spore-associated protein A [Nocardiopsis listeri]|uniref:spore-associated protein A n=1 Tax=Nocardiopsis listeri TaxID=53440 RepID=UPI00082DB9D2|nr:spore-associated protein A [Nocardiopsis listeri]
MSALRGAAVAAALGLAATGILVASPAHAAAYNDACGAGYGVVRKMDIGDSGTAFLTYNASNGYNCAVTVRNSPGDPIEVVVGIKRTADDPADAVQDAGMYTTYAGPVYLHAPATCVDWFGHIGGDNNNRNQDACG